MYMTHSLKQGQGAVIGRVYPHCQSDSHPLMPLEEAIQLLSEGEEGLSGCSRCVSGEQPTVQRETQAL